MGIGLAWGRGILALFFRSLRGDARSITMYLVWTALLVVLYGTMWYAQEMQRWMGAPGLQLFRSVMFMDAVFLSLLGVSYFSSVISEEKEEDTLGLMIMAGISHLGILLGKSTSRLFQVAILIGLQYPVTLLAVTLGGLVSEQVLASYVALLAFTILIANVALLCSVVCRTTRSASSLVVLWLITYNILPGVAFGGLRYLQIEEGWSLVNATWGEWLTLWTLRLTSESNVFRALYETTETGSQLSWTVQNVGNLAGGVLCFLTAWGLFGVVSKEPATDSQSRGPVARQSSRWWRAFSAGRVWSLPLVWKDFFFVAGGWIGVTVRVFLYLSLYAAVYYLNRPWWNSYQSVNWSEITAIFQAFAHVLFAADLGLCASRVFQVELRGQTLPSLMMLPVSAVEVAYAKLFGGTLVTWPGALAILFSMILLPGGTRYADEILDEPGFWWWILNLVFMIHLSVVLSLYFRSGAFVISVGTMIGLMILTVMVIASVFDDEAGFVFFNMLLMFGCVGCHVALIRYLPILAER